MSQGTNPWIFALADKKFLPLALFGILFSSAFPSLPVQSFHQIVDQKLRIVLIGQVP